MAQGQLARWGHLIGDDDVFFWQIGWILAVHVVNVKECIYEPFWGTLPLPISVLVQLNIDHFRTPKRSLRDKSPAWPKGNSSSYRAMMNGGYSAIGDNFVNWLEFWESYFVRISVKRQPYHLLHDQPLMKKQKQGVDLTWQMTLGIGHYPWHSSQWRFYRWQLGPLPEKVRQQLAGCWSDLWSPQVPLIIYTPGKMMVGRRNFIVGMAPFQGLC